MAETVSDFMVQRLYEWGVHRIYGYPGDGMVLEAITDPNVPPLPPHITLEQAKAYVSALLKGDPDALGIIKQSFREVFP